MNGRDDQLGQGRRSLPRHMRIAKESDLKITPAISHQSAGLDVTDHVVLAQLVGHAEPGITVGEQLPEEMDLKLPAPAPFVRRIIPAEPRIQDGGKGSPFMPFHQFLTNAIGGEFVIVELAGIAPDTVGQKGPLIGHQVHIIGKQAHHGIGFAMTIEEREVRRGIHGGDRIRRSPPGRGKGSIVQPGNLISVSEERQQRNKHIPALRRAGRAVAEILRHEQDVRPVRVHPRFISQRLLDEDAGFGRSVHRRAAHVNFSQQIHFPARFAVRGFAKDVISVAIPRPIQAGVIQVRRNPVIRRQRAHVGIPIAAGYRRDVPPEQHIVNAPIRVGIADVVPNLLRRIAPRITVGDRLHGHHLDGEAIQHLLIDEWLKRRHQIAPGDEQIIETGSAPRRRNNVVRHHLGVRHFSRQTLADGFRPPRAQWRFRRGTSRSQFHRHPHSRVG